MFSRLLYDTTKGLVAQNISDANNGDILPLLSGNEAHNMHAWLTTIKLQPSSLSKLKHSLLNWWQKFVNESAERRGQVYKFCWNTKSNKMALFVVTEPTAICKRASLIICEI